MYTPVQLLYANNKNIKENTTYQNLQDARKTGLTKFIAICSSLTKKKYLKYKHLNIRPQGSRKIKINQAQS
jgi:hypothetical protein